MIHSILNTVHNNKKVIATGGGSGYGVVKYKHIQVFESPIWTIHHNMNAEPFVMTISNGVQVHGSVKYINSNTIYVYFSQPVKGVAYCL